MHLVSVESLSKEDMGKVFLLKTSDGQNVLYEAVKGDFTISMKDIKALCRIVINERLLPFGIKTAPTLFQRTMETLLRDLPHVCVYIDNILVTRPMPS